MDINDFFQIWQEGFHFGHSTVLYQRDCLCEVGMFDPDQRRRHDIDLWLRMIAGRTWTYDTATEVGYRENTPGSISKNDLECDYFYLRALVKNLDLVDAPFFREHLRRCARAAIGIAFTDGSAEQFSSVRQLALPHLPLIYRSAYRFAAVWPGPIRAMIKAKRHIVMSGADPAQKRSLAKVVGVCAMAMTAVALTLPRRRAYRRLLKYHPRQDCVPGFAGPAIESIVVRCDERGIVFTEFTSDVASCVLELRVRASATGAIFDPSLEIRGSGFRDLQFLERGVCGVRFFNLSRLVVAVGSAGGQVWLRGRHMTWFGESARLHLFSERLSSDDRILIIGPHPDDAEIAAFGLYADSDATVVTLTAGDDSATVHNMHGSRACLAKMRVWDSITIPQFGNVPLERAINLCFPDGKLADMHNEPQRDFRGKGPGALDFAGLRRLNRSSLVRDASACNWSSLIRDLSYIISETRPTIIVAPHPSLDPNSDHLYATVAVCEALEQVALTTGRFFLYTVHNRRSELWPFGPAGAGVTLLPVFADDGVCAPSFYSHPLSADRQRDKFLALEAMHDLRDIEWPSISPAITAGRRLRAELRGLVHGMGRNPTSYFRRAVRPDEVFFVASFADAIERVRGALAATAR
jgi:hypothetical protein